MKFALFLDINKQFTISKTRLLSADDLPASLPLLDPRTLLDTFCQTKVVLDNKNGKPCSKDVYNHKNVEKLFENSKVDVEGIIKEMFRPFIKMSII